MKSSYQVLTQERLKEILNYDPETGIFFWKTSVGKKIKAGDIAGCITRYSRMQICIFGKRYLSHRLAWLYVHGNWPKNQIDHKNGNPSDNRIDNLRDVTDAQNKQNRHRPNSNNKLCFLGVCARGMKFRARIIVDGKTYWLGTFSTPELAQAAYLSGKRKYHGFCTI